MEQQHSEYHPFSACGSSFNGFGALPPTTSMRSVPSVVPYSSITSITTSPSRMTAVPVNVAHSRGAQQQPEDLAALPVEELRKRLELAQAKLVTACQPSLPFGMSNTASASTFYALPAPTLTRDPGSFQSSTEEGVELCALFGHGLQQDLWSSSEPFVPPSCGQVTEVDRIFIPSLQGDSLTGYVPPTSAGGKELDQEPAALSTVPAPLPGKLTPEERQQKIERYRSKRLRRVWNHKVKYQCRKQVADTRPRIRGRFARDDELGAVYPGFFKKQQRQKSGRGRSPVSATEEADGQSAAAEHECAPVEGPLGGIGQLEEQVPGQCPTFGSVSVQDVPGLETTHSMFLPDCAQAGGMPLSHLPPFAGVLQAGFEGMEGVWEGAFDRSNCLTVSCELPELLL